MTDTERPDISKAAQKWFGRPASDLDEHEQRALRRAAARKPVSADVNESFEEGLSFSQRMADRIAEIGGSWTFIIAFAIFLGAWVSLNLGLGLLRDAFDPFPFVFLNLILSMLTAVQAPVIMMSQNRQAAKDRLDASHDYEVNLKAEIEIMALHDKLDQLRTQDLETMIRKQQEQIDLLARLVEARGAGGRAG
jgi:uncharacterized membrane protein